MRTAVAIVIGIAIGVASAGATFLAVERPDASRPVGGNVASDEPVRLPAPAIPRAPDASTPGKAAPMTSRALPVTPVYGSVPDATRPIYRCSSRGATAYSNEPCPGATVVDEANAVAGYDTRPSDRLARLVAEGRTAPGAPSLVARSSAAPARESVECDTLRQQIRDLDATALQPNTPKTLDELRRIRQDIRTSMARGRCPARNP